MENEYYPFINLPLPYEYGSLEPYIDEKTMMLHHDKHLQTYINNLNAALIGNPYLQKLSLEQLIMNASRLPKELQNAVRNNAGGVYNHRFYFNLLKKTSEEKPYGKLAEAIDKSFGSYNKFMDAFTKAAMSVFGSGYAWLVSDRGVLKIVTTPNQNSPVQNKLCPILAIDVWEHAYYLKHYNVRADYIKDWFNVINWNQAERNYRNCI
ncbi:MAG: superoxide dismutase [Oscillospiraceae bacterium]|nr:superoxide dismutase [Oscillospiraceae bacterium]